MEKDFFGEGRVKHTKEKFVLTLSLFLEGSANQPIDNTRVGTNNDPDRIEVKPLVADGYSQITVSASYRQTKAEKRSLQTHLSSFVSISSKYKSISSWSSSQPVGPVCFYGSIFWGELSVQSEFPLKGSNLRAFSLYITRLNLLDTTIQFSGSMFLLKMLLPFHSTRARMGPIMSSIYLYLFGNSVSNTINVMHQIYVLRVCTIRYKGCSIQRLYTFT